MKIMFVFAHPDDEAFGPAGTIAKLAEHNDVYVLCLCKGNRPGYEQVSATRIQQFEQSCKLLGVTGILKDSSDLYLDYHVALKDIEQQIRFIDPEIVYTHNISDIHPDHRVTAEACMAACRPKATSNIRALYMCEIPASTEWTFGTRDPVFQPNFYIDITDYIKIKKKVVGLYTTEVYEFPDARSIKSMEVTAQFRGKQVGSQFAEAFQLVFFHDRNIQ